MAVQAQYPSNVLLLNRSDQERKEMDYTQQQPGFFDQSTMFFSNGASTNPRKRGRDAAVQVAENHHINLFSLQPQPSLTLPPPTLISLAQLRPQPSPLVSTGLRLALEDQHNHQHQHQHQNQTNLLLSSSFSEDLTTQINQQNDEIDRFLHAQAEQLRRTMAERRRRHYLWLLSAAEEWAARKFQEKEAELNQAVRRTADLEDRLARLRSESMAWQTKAMTDQATAAALQAQLHQAAAVAAAAPQEKGDECGESPAEDAESAHIDPERVERERPPVACRSCRGRPVSVVLLPCRHLCLCGECDAAGVVESCPVCRCVRSGSVQVFLT